MAGSALGALLLGLGLAAAGCGGGPSPTAVPGGGDRWRDIDPTRPSEDPVATVYGFVQAMAAGDEQRACAFQHRGSSDPDPEPCVLAEEMPRADRDRTAAEWRALAAYRLPDYTAREQTAGRRPGWRVSLPTDPPTTWRITQDDAGLWFLV